ncbi:hypothetical protein Q2T91_16180 [Ralstonia pseudosolanacearum]|uniref:hypothetical protein n=1 Tax=Ralstonia pseudosolanacearum TaxID=1310165 RepID=UPI00399BD467
MQTEVNTELVGLIRDYISGLSDGDIVLLEAGRFGLAIFPRSKEIWASDDFTNSRWRFERDDWEEHYGRGAQLHIRANHPDRLSELLEGHSDDFAHALAERMDDPKWLATCARQCREVMLTELSLSNAAEQVGNIWEDAAEAAHEQVEQAESLSPTSGQAARRRVRP